MSLSIYILILTRKRPNKKFEVFGKGKEVKVRRRNFVK